MINEVKKKIDDDNEVLNILPQNNAINRKKYRSKLMELKEEYLGKQKEVINFINNKNVLLKAKYNINHVSNIEKLIDVTEKRLNYFNPYQDPYEILGLDKLFYELYKYYDNDLNSYNSNINQILTIFETAHVVLTKKDFYFSDSAEEYMDVFLKERKNGNYNSQLVKETFERLFWKSHDMMRYILINFKYLYHANEKKFKEYIVYARKQILTQYGNSYEKLLASYRDLIVKNNDFYLHNWGVFYEKFANNDLLVNDYDKDKIDKLMNEYNTTNKDIYKKLYASIREEMFIYEHQFVLDEIDKLYQDKDNFKNIVSETNKEINGLIKNVTKKRKKLKSKGLFKPKNVNLLKKEIEDSLVELTTKYEQLDENRYKEKIAALVNPTIKDYYLIGMSYLFMQDICKEKEDVNVDKIIRDISRNLYNPYNALIENIKYKNIEELNLIVFDKYRLLGLSLTVDSFLIDNLDSFIKTIGNIIIYYALTELDVKLDEIDFILQSDEIMKKLS